MEFAKYWEERQIYLKNKAREDEVAFKKKVGFMTF